MTSPVGDTRERPRQVCASSHSAKCLEPRGRWFRTQVANATRYKRAFSNVATTGRYGSFVLLCAPTPQFENAQLASLVDRGGFERGLFYRVGHQDIPRSVLIHNPQSPIPNPHFRVRSCDFRVGRRGKNPKGEDGKLTRFVLARNSATVRCPQSALADFAAPSVFVCHAGGVPLPFPCPRSGFGVFRDEHPRSRIPKMTEL